MLSALRRLGTSKTIVFAIALMLFAGAIGVLTVDVLRKLDRLGTASSDIVQWSLSQLEVDYVQMARAADSALSGEPDLAEVRRRFDLFYSRFDILRDSSLYSSLRSAELMAQHFDRIGNMLDAAIPAIDGSDAELLAALPGLVDDINSIDGNVRHVALSGVTMFSAQSDRERERVSVTLLRLALAVAALVLLLVGAAVCLSKALRTSNERARKLRDSTRRLETIVETSLDAVVMADEVGDILEVGGTAEKLFGRDRDTLRGMSLIDLVQDDDIKLHSRWLSKKTHLEAIMGDGPDGERSRRVRVTGFRGNGETFPVEMSIADAQSSSGLTIVAYLRDISKQIEAERALTVARDDALVAARSKAEFLAVMSHEMRTPLGGLLGSLENLRDTELNTQQREWLDIMETSGRILQDNVNDVLDIAKLEAGKTRLQTEAVDLASLLERLVSTQRSIASERGNQIELSLPKEEIGLVMVDPPRLRQIMLNLLGNAIKFTQDGRITVGMRVKTINANEVSLDLVVTDTGMGIPKDRLNDIFEDFVTLDSAYSRSVSGTGLGLGIVRRLVAVMDGQINVESVENVGSSFTVSLTLTRVDAAPEQGAQLSSLPQGGKQKLKVLLFEDNAINRRVICHQLQTLGYEATAAEDGLNVEEIAAKTCFDVILMDISMPCRDGIATTKIIRSAGLNIDTPIVAMTAHALPEEIARFHAAGMQACLTKPVQRAVLNKTIKEWAGIRIFPSEKDQKLVEDISVSSEATEGESRIDTSAPLVDEQHLQEMRAELGDVVFDRLCGAALVDGDQLIAALKELNASTEAGEVAHRLAGTAASFGAKRLHANIAAIEAKFLSAETSAEERQKHIADLAMIWSETREILTTWQGAGAHSIKRGYP